MEQRLSGPEKRPSARDSINEEDGSRSKRLKQGRLPFKPLDCKPLTTSNKTSSRKRKLSEQDSPSNKSKHPKLPDLKNAGEKGKSTSVKDDNNEVSSTSSSETEHLTVSSSKSKTGKANLLEKFVRREDEISSTNDVIDLTDSLDESGPNENSPVTTRSPKKTVLISPLKSPRAKPEAVLKDKAEYNFSRKLVFDKEESAKSETEDVLGDSASPSKEQEATQEKTSVECGASVDDKEGGDTNEDGKGSLQEDEADTPTNENGKGSLQETETDTPTNIDGKGSLQEDETDTPTNIDGKGSLQEDETDTPTNEDGKGSLQEDEADTPTNEDGKGSLQEDEADTPTNEDGKGSLQEDEADTPTNEDGKGSLQEDEADDGKGSLQEDEADDGKDSIQEDEADDGKDSLQEDEADDGKDSIQEGETDDGKDSIQEGEADDGKDSIQEDEADDGKDSIQEGETDDGKDSIQEGETDDRKDSIQEGETDAPSKDESPNSSESESSDSEPSTPEKEEGGDSPSDDKTPASRDCPSLTDTPQTPASSNTSRSSTDGTTPLSSSTTPRVLSKKQLGRQALRQKVKDDKDKQKQDEKDQKEKERLEKKQKRDEEKAERDRAKKEEKGKKEKERLEKKEQAEKEKQTKIQQKEEEKQKKLDKVNAEKKMKEEEKNQKEEQKQKEEDDKVRQAQKRKAAFTSFFIKPKAVTYTKVIKAEDSLFIPFELMKDMTLAPVIRHKLSEEDKQCLRSILSREESGEITYLDELKQKLRRPKRTFRMLRERKEIEQDVVLVHDSETVKKVTHAVKLLKFHTDYRPPYFGTWRKKVTGLSPRNPWKKDEAIFDYEVDSDDEWEEEEPGESLSDSNGEEEEGEEDDDGDDDGWMVPHGYLSEDEGCQDDEDVTPDVMKARQRAKALAWESEMKAKKKMMPPLHLGCFWLDRPCVREEHLTIIKNFEMVCLRSSPIKTLLSCPTMCEAVGDRSADSTSPTYKGCRKRALPEEAMPDLIRLVQGNYAGIKKLVREFRLFWKQKCSDVNLSLDESRMEEEEESKVLNDCVMDSSANLEESVLETVEPAADATKTTECEPMQIESSDKTADEEASGKKQDDNIVTEELGDSCVSKRQLEIKIMSIAVREKRPGKKQCWYVNDSTLKQYKLEDLTLENSWVYVSGDLGKKMEKTPKAMPEKKTPTHSAEVRVSKSKDPGKPADTDSSITPHKGKDVAGSDATPKSSKSKKEASAKKTPKDQPSIRAFAKKASAGGTGDKTEPSGSKRDTAHSAEEKSAEVGKAGGDTTTEGVDLVSTEQPASSQQTAEPMDEDCIIILD